MASTGPISQFTGEENALLETDEVELVEGFKPVLGLIAIGSLAIFTPLIEMGTGHAVNALQKSLTYAGKYLGGGLRFTFDHILEPTIAPIAQGMLDSIPNVATSDFDAEGKHALRVIDGLVGFATAMTLGVAAAHAPIKAIMGHRFGDAVWEAVGRIPEEMGLSWAMGIVISDSFKAALGTALERNIWRQTRPNEPEWPIVRQMLRQHVLGETALDEVLENAGYSQKWIDRIHKLETQPIPLGDIQTLYQSEEIDDTKLDQLLISLGFSNENRKLLKTLYIDKAETSAGATLRSIAREQYKLGHITEIDYRHILQHVNFPSRLIDDDIAAITLETSLGWRQRTVASIKSAFLHNTLNEQTAKTQLAQIGLDPSAAQGQIDSWKAPPLPRIHGLTETQVLKYFVAGLLDAVQARDLLTALGLDPKTVTFLVANPTAAPGVHMRKLTPGLVTQAYIAGALTQADLPAAYKKALVPDDQVNLYITIANQKFAQHHEPNSGQQPLVKQEILQGFKYGIFDEPSALVYLQQLGYSSANAEILLEIENHGAIKPPPQQVFATINDALNYLLQAGYTVNPPPDPTLLAAETMVEAAGYTVVPHQFIVTGGAYTFNSTAEIIAYLTSIGYVVGTGTAIP